MLSTQGTNFLCFNYALGASLGAASGSQFVGTEMGGNSNEWATDGQPSPKWSTIAPSIHFHRGLRTDFANGSNLWL